MQTLRSLTYLIGGLFLWVNASAGFAQEQQNEALVTIVNPQFNSAQIDSYVEVGVRFSKEAKQDTFTARLNGEDITSSFYFTSRCANDLPCNKQASLQANTLRNGQNVVNVDIVASTGAVATARVRFTYDPISANSDSVDHLTPAAGIQAVTLSGSASDPTSYKTVIGPGPGFTRRIYSPEGLSSCSIDGSMYVLVLKRSSLDLDTSVNSGKGQFCSSSASDLSAQLKNVNKGSLVIMHSFTGVVTNLDATAIGGTKFAGSGITPYAYNAIGVAGATAGSAHESYRRNSLEGNTALLVPLDGSLMLDVRQQYDFVPSAFRTLKVTPNDPKYPGFSTIDYNGSLQKANLPSGSAGGFWILTLDRHTGAVKDWYVLETNTGNADKDNVAFNDLRYLLDVYYNSPENLLILTTVGYPVVSPWSVTEGLMAAVNRLGGTGNALPRLVATADSYTLITSPDPDYVKGHYAIESSKALGNPYQTGELDGFMSRNRKNLWSMHSAVTDSGLTHPMNFEWSKIAFQAPQDWPAWNARQQKAYEDLTASSDHYPYVRETIGCTTGCGAIRSYYDGGIGSSGRPKVLGIDYDRISYYPNADYGAGDLEAVTKQLRLEKTYIGNVYLAYDQFRALTNDQSGTLQAQLQAVANNIDSSLAGGNDNNELVLKRLTQASQVTTVLSAIPGIGSSFGAITVTLDTAAALVPQYDGVPNDGRYGYTLRQLRDGALTAGSDMADSIDSLFLGMVTDWGKISIVGPGYGNKEIPWYMCVSCEKSNVPRAALPVLALAAKQQFYLQLMPTVYDSDLATNLQTPSVNEIGAKWTLNKVPRCLRLYEGAPTDAWQGYLHGSPSTFYDVFVIANKERGTSIFGYKEPKYPSQNLLSDLFDEPVIKGADLTGGAGLLKTQFLPSKGYLAPREAYRGVGACTP